MRARHELFFERDHRRRHNFACSSRARHISRLLAASASPLAEFSLRILRTIILSHLLSPSDVGATIVLISILSSCELITDVGLDKFVLIASGNTRAQAVAAARQIAIARGVLLAAAIALGAPFLAGVYGAGEHHTVIVWIGLVPLIRGFRNLRVVQIQREYKYGIETINNLGAHICGILAILPAISWLHDERAMLISLVVEAIIFVVLSELLVQREPVIAIDPVIRRNAITFGLPLMANGLALIAVKQLDQVIVANLFNLSTLALYSLALNLAIAPTSVMQRIAWKIGIPFLARSHASLHASREASAIVVLGMVIAAAAYAIFLGVFLESLIPFVYGRGYKATPTFCTLVTLAAFLRFCRGGPNIVFASIAETGRLTIGNMVAGSGVIVGLLLGLTLRDINGILAGFIVGDLLSFIALIALLRRRLLMGAMTFHLAILGTAVFATLFGPLIPADLYAFEARVAVQMTVIAVVGLDAALVYRSINRDPFKGAALGGDRREPNDQQMSLKLRPTAIAEGKG